MDCIRCGKKLKVVGELVTCICGYSDFKKNIPNGDYKKMLTELQGACSTAIKEAVEAVEKTRESIRNYEIVKSKIIKPLQCLRDVLGKSTNE